MVTTRGRRVRLGAAAAVLGLLLAGTAWGSDDHFPFGPFRMYATATKPTARVAVVVLVATDEAGRTFELDGEDVGLRRAELEGQLPRLRRDPDLLGAVATAYGRRRASAAPLERVALVSRGVRLAEGGVGPEEDRVLAEWPRR